MLRTLLERFEDEVHLPIEIEELRGALIELGFQDEIIFAAEPMETGTLKGVFYQYVTRDGVYADPVLTTLIVYPENEDPKWQRAICAKELIHICDRQIVKTNTIDEVRELAAKVVGPFESGNAELTDIMAATDKLAQYQALHLLFPKASRDLARAAVREGRRTVADIANWVSLPEEHVEFMLTDDWEQYSELFMRFFDLASHARETA